MRLTHLALAVRDPEASARFYREVIGLSGRATAEDWGQRLDLDDGFTFALIAGDPLPSDVVGRVHFGATVGSPEDVHAIRARLRDAGVHEVEWVEEERFTSVEVADLDAYLVEISGTPPDRS